MRKTCLFNLFLFGISAPLAAEHPIPFTVKVLTVDANEGCDIADFDGDGKLDVVAGRNWFRNGDWAARPVRIIEDFNGYLHTNGDFIWDVNQDGRPDVVAGDFFSSEVYWYENPGGDALLQGFLWPKHLLVDTGFQQNEASFLHDFDGDGTPEWISNSWVKDNPLIIWSFSHEERTVTEQKGNRTLSRTDVVPSLKRHLVGEPGGQGHGFGIGDVNNDGREDILTGTGWHEAPEGNPLDDSWTFHADWTRYLSDPVLVRDLNSDGRNDVIWGNPHDYGLIVWFALPPSADGTLQFNEKIVDDSYSQLHCVLFEDLDGDGQDELITGKRVRAHNGKDPGGTEPPLVCYYTIDPQTQEFTRHLIEDGHVGIGLQIRTADLDADGDLDIVLAGKEGTQILFSQIK